MESILSLPSPFPARGLLGCIIHRRLPSGVILSGRIVETEFYHQSDPASHSFNGPTPRTLPMFSGPGHAYVYRSYGIHNCLNITAHASGTGCGVLIRALEPVEGADYMREHRGQTDLRKLMNGPGNVAQALKVDLSFSGRSVLDKDGELFVTPGDAPPDEQIGVSPRIGITRAVDVPWRFFIKGNPHVSGPRVVKLKKGTKVVKAVKQTVRARRRKVIAVRTE